MLGKNHGHQKAYNVNRYIGQKGTLRLHAGDEKATAYDSHWQWHKRNIVGSWSDRIRTRHRAKARRMKKPQQMKQRGFWFNGSAGAAITLLCCRLF